MLFLKNEAAPRELHRSALKFIKVSITYLDFSNQSELPKLILNHCSALKNSRKHTTTLRRIIAKLISRVGISVVRSATTSEHLPLVNYVERRRRKKQNAKDRQKMLALLGKDSGKLRSEDNQAPDLSVGSDSEGDDEQDQEEKGVDSSDSDSE